MLPREIRDVIYTYVLHLDRFKIQQSISHRGNLDASILYLNKQIHAEALEAVRNQACWMLLIMDYETYEHIRHHVRRTFATPGTDRLGSLMIDSQEAIDFMKTFAITLTIGLDLADPLLNCGGRPPQVQGGRCQSDCSNSDICHFENLEMASVSQCWATHPPAENNQRRS